MFIEIGKSLQCVETGYKLVHIICNFCEEKVLTCMKKLPEGHT